MAKRTWSAELVVGQWADGARKSKRLPDRQFAFPGGGRARCFDNKPTVNVAGPTPPRPVIITRLHCVSLAYDSRP